MRRRSTPARRFDRLRSVAVRHDERLRSLLSDDEHEQLADLLDKLQTGLAEPVATAAPPTARRPA